MEQTASDQVEEIEVLLGKGDRRNGRERLKKICNVIDSAVSNWKAKGIPNAHRAIISSFLDKSGIGSPEWILDIPVPKTLEEVDRMPRKVAKTKLTVPA